MNLNNDVAKSIFEIIEARNKSDPLNDNGDVSISAERQEECTRISMRHIRIVYQIKADILGVCYTQLGELVWQMLCEIHLSAGGCSLTHLQQSLELSSAIATRYATILETHGLVEKRPADPNSISTVGMMEGLVLTDLGRSKVEQVIELSTDAFNEMLVIYKPYVVSA